MAKPVKPDDDFFLNMQDLSMNNLDVNTIWFEDGTFLNSAKGLVGTAGGLSFQYSVNINNQNDPGNNDMTDGKLRFNSQIISDSTSLFVSTKTHVLDTQTGTSIDLRTFFDFVKQRTSAIKTFAIIYKKTDSSKKIIFSVSDIVVSSFNHATFTLDREVALSSDTAPFEHDDDVILSFKILGDKGPQGPPVNGGGMLPYEPFGISSAFTEYNFNNTQRATFSQFQPPTNGDYTHIKLYATGAMGSNGLYTGWLGVGIYTHVDAPQSSGPNYNAQNMNGYPNELIGSGVLTLTQTRVNSKHLEIAFDQPISFETDKLYWVAIGAYSQTPVPNLSSFQSLQMLREQVNSNPPESPAFSRYLTYDANNIMARSCLLSTATPAPRTST